MLNLRVVQLLSFLSLSFSMNGQISDLIISEYAEGSSNNKYVDATFPLKTQSCSKIDYYK